VTTKRLMQMPCVLVNTDSPRLLQSQATQYPIYSIKRVKNEIVTFFKHTEILLAEVKAHCDESDGRILLGDNRRRGGHTAAGRLPVCWSLDFDWTPFCVHVWFTVCILDSELRRIRLAPELPERNNCLSLGVSECNNISQHPAASSFRG
jgi:hypothetical protein